MSPPSQIQISSGTQQEHPESFARRVVVADDDPAFRDYAATVLVQAGYEVVQARDGAGLLECIDFSSFGPNWNISFDAVVADFCMPGITGIEVLEGLALAGLADRVVLISGFADAETLRWARKVGAAAALSKPFSAEDLLSAVSKASCGHQEVSCGHQEASSCGHQERGGVNT